MTKVLVLDDRQFQELKRIFEYTMKNFLMPQDMEITSFYDSIQRAFEYTGNQITFQPDAERVRVVAAVNSADMPQAGKDALLRKLLGKEQTE